MFVMSVLLLLQVITAVAVYVYIQKVGISRVRSAKILEKFKEVQAENNKLKKELTEQKYYNSLSRYNCNTTYDLEC